MRPPTENASFQPASCGPRPASREGPSILSPNRAQESATTGETANPSRA